MFSEVSLVENRKSGVLFSWHTERRKRLVTLENWKIYGNPSPNYLSNNYSM